MKLVQYNGWLFSTVDTDDLVPYHQGISSYKAEYALIFTQLFMDQNL